nr:uncharacterized protein LOC112286725 isoform X2 [Physcomitrium patens]|eukprot:XP_024384669.1 uncharacterized protein LOC112286725 isoform X2 [Physcomitrella patens]
MQAHRGEAAEVQQKSRQRAGHYVVVKAVVDQVSQRAALLLADSSCLLVSLAGSQSKVVPIAVPAPCTDACFLRLQAYGPAGAAPSASGLGNKFGNGLSPSSSRTDLGDSGESGALKIVPGESPTFRAQELREREATGKLSGGNVKAKGQGLAGVRRELFVVTSRPAKGGSCTDLRAWSCAESAFVGADIELEPGNRRFRAREGPHDLLISKAFARLDAPHGFAVKMAASINVIILYSSSAGKFWVMAGKWFDQAGGPSHIARAEDVFAAETYEKKRLVLMKCAVVHCHEPVYSIHVSPLHLFLGENKGVRVWSLRPLIKPGSHGRSCGKFKSMPQGTSEQDSYQSSKKLDCETCVRIERCQHVTESGNALGKIDVKKGAGCGALLEENMDARDNMEDIAMEKLLRGLYGTRELNVGTSVSGFRTQRKSNVSSRSYLQVNNFRSLSELQSALKIDIGLDNSSAEDDIAAKTTMENGGGGLIKNEAQNGVLLSYPVEHGDISFKEKINVRKLHGTQGNVITSSAEAVRSDYCNGDHPLKIAPRPRNGFISVSESPLEAQPVASLSAKKMIVQQSGATVHGTDTRVQSRMNLKEPDSAGVWFVDFSGTEGIATAQGTSHAGPKLSPKLQVVDIQAFSPKEYIALDSKGALHLLTLNEVTEAQKTEDPGRSFVTVTHLHSTMRVSSFAVLPLPPTLPQVHRDFFSPAAATVRRKLWICDGMYSVHVVIFPEEKSKASIDFAATEATLAGKLFSYVMPAS